MAHNHDREHHGATHDLLAMPLTSSTTLPTTMEEDLVADVDEPPDQLSFKRHVAPEFHKSIVLPLYDRKESLLTRALHPTSTVEAVQPEIHSSTDMSRRRSTLSNTSAASMADLTSDGGITSPARTDTPSPPLPNSTYLNLEHYTLETKEPRGPVSLKVKYSSKDDIDSQSHSPSSRGGLPKVDPAVEALVKKRCISFACGGQKPSSPTTVHHISKKADAEPHKVKRSMIKFACPFPQNVEPPAPPKDLNTSKDLHTSPAKASTPVKPSRSPSVGKKIRPTPSPHTKLHRESSSTVRRSSQSPMSVRRRKPTFILADEEALRSSEATHFHEFASDEVHEDDWIRRDLSDIGEKLTIHDTLKKENAIRQLGKEAEEEAMEDEETAGEISEENEYDEDDADEFEEAEDQFDDDRTVDGSDVDENGSDGNETDNEAGFADSDDEIDTTGEYQFWTPGKTGETNTFRASALRTASESSIDSLKHMNPIAEAFGDSSKRRSRPSRKIKIRPGTPDLPDSTDFVCGTLDEDRPLEEAYVSCIEARKREKHHLIPQDIDPSFPTSDPEDGADNDLDVANESEEQVWLHGKFEDSDEEQSRRSRRIGRKSPNHSPNRLHSPPPKRHLSPAPVKHRHRSPPPRRLFGGHSPRRMRSPPPAQIVKSPPASPTAAHGGISFAQVGLGRRPGLTHTKSLPRRPHGFIHHYQAARLSTISGDDENDPVEGHTRSAIDIVKGLEQKRQRRKEKFFQKMCNRARKGQHIDRKPMPGKGAERMRDIGLQMAGKTEIRNGMAEYVLSV